MDQRARNEAAAQSRTAVERASERELVVRRYFDGPARTVFAAWTSPDLLRRWWAPKSTQAVLVACETDVRVGGGYRFTFSHPAAAEPMVFFGRYLEVEPPTRLVWTNEESDGGAVSTLTLEENGGRTLLVLHELYPSKEALDAAIEGMEGGLPEQFGQLDALLATLAAGTGRS